MSPHLEERPAGSGETVAEGWRVPIQAGQESAPPPGAGRGRRRRRRTRRTVLLAGLALVVLVALVVGLLVGRQSKPPVPVGGPHGVSWKLAFDENFNTDKTTLLSSGVWHSGWFGDGKLTGPVNSEETALFSTANLSIADGRATFEVTPNVDHLALPDGLTQPNLGAALNTDDKQARKGFMFGYGYVEARMQMPAGSPGDKLWPSFWLTGHTWPDDMEIDVVEGDGTDQGNKFNIHYGSNNEDTVNLNNVHRKRTVPGATTGMHTYAADIEPDGVTFYYDGKAVYSYKGTVPDAQRYLMVGISTSGTVTSPKALQVDYVRAWTRN